MCTAFTSLYGTRARQAIELTSKFAPECSEGKLHADCLVWGAISDSLLAANTVGPLLFSICNIEALRRAGFGCRSNTGHTFVGVLVYA